MTTITYDDFAKVELRFGTILVVDRVPKSDKLLHLIVDFGDGSPRTIASGIGKTVTDPSTLVGQQRLFVTNLAPRKVMGIESNGMMLAAGEDAEHLSFVAPTAPVAPGSQVR